MAVPEHVLDVSITKTYGDFELNVTFQFDGGLIALFGPSGAGKTTLVNAFAGLIAPDSGVIRISDVTVFDSSAAINLPPEKRHLGYVFQDARLFPHMSVEKNLRFGIKQIPDDERHIKWNDILKIMDLGKLLSRWPHTLSGGEKQRVAIGRALLASPQLLLMDEPLSSLDIKRKAEIFPFIERLRDQLNVPIVYVTHTVPEILRLADQVIVLDQGKLAAMGPVDQVLNRLEIQTGFEPSVFEPISELGTILTAKVESHDEQDQLTMLDLSGDRLYVPRLALNVGSTVRLRIRARDVALARHPPKDISVLNCIKANVVDVANKGASHTNVKLRSAAGHEFWSQITRRSQRELAIEPGVEIWALIKSVALERGF